MSEWTKVRIGDLCKTNTKSYSPKEGWTFVNYLDTGNITKNVVDKVQYIDREAGIKEDQAKLAEAKNK